MSQRPDIVVPASLPPQLRQVLAAIYQRLRSVEGDVATLTDRLGVVANRTTGSSSSTRTSTTPTAASALTVTTLTTNTTLTAVGVYLCDESGGAFTATLPTAVGKTGQIWYFLKIGGTADIVTIAAFAGETIEGQPDLDMTSPTMSITLFSDGVNWRII